MAADSVLSIHDLSIDFLTPRGAVHALRNIKVSVPRGSIVGIVGEADREIHPRWPPWVCCRECEVAAGVLFDGPMLTMSGALRALRAPRVHGVPGPPDVAQSRAVHRPQMTTSNTAIRGAAEKRRKAAGAASRRHPDPRSGWPFRTSSAAACASASPSPWACSAIPSC
jgi:hypothetical protein